MFMHFSMNTNSNITFVLCCLFHLPILPICPCSLCFHHLLFWFSLSLMSSPHQQYVIGRFLKLLRRMSTNNKMIIIRCAIFHNISELTCISQLYPYSTEPKYIAFSIVQVRFEISGIAGCIWDQQAWKIYLNIYLIQAIFVYMNMYTPCIHCLHTTWDN